MSFKQKNTKSRFAISVPLRTAVASVASFAAVIAAPAHATILAVDLTSNAACADATTCQFTLGSRTMDVLPFKDYPNAGISPLISYSATRGLGVSGNPDGARIGISAGNPEALKFIVSGAGVTLREIVVFDVDPAGVDTAVTFDLYVDGVREYVLTGNGFDSALTFDLTAATALVNDFTGSTFAIVATVGPEAGFHARALEFDVPTVIIVDPPVTDLPSPATLGLFGLGLAALSVGLRRPNRAGGAGGN